MKLCQQPHLLYIYISTCASLDRFVVHSSLMTMTIDVTKASEISELENVFVFNSLTEKP